MGGAEYMFGHAILTRTRNLGAVRPVQRRLFRGSSTAVVLVQREWIGELARLALPR